MTPAMSRALHLAEQLIARRSVTPDDAGDRLARLELFARQPVIQVALQIQRRHVGIVGIVEPGTAAQFVGLAIGF